MRRIALCSGLLALMIVSPGGATAKTSPGQCDVHRQGALRATPKVLVYAKRDGQEDLGAVYYACGRPNGKRVRLGLNAPDVSGEYGSDATLTALTVRGTFAAAESTSGFGAALACSKYNAGGSCPSGTRAIEVADTAAERRVTIPTGTASALVLSSAGATAWLEASDGGSSLHVATLAPRGAHGFAVTSKQLDAGQIQGLRFVGQVLHWTSGGVARAVAVS